MGKENHSKKQSEQEESHKKRFPDEVELPHDLQAVWDTAVKDAIEWDNKQRGTDMLTPIQSDAIKEREFRKKVENYPLCKQCDFTNYKLQKCNIYKNLRECCDAYEEE